MKAPFPWFGGKARIASEVWRRFGNVPNYVEPFAGSLAVLLARPEPWDGIETVNDKDGMVSNFWRALQADPDAVAHHADWPVNENDLHARHAWLVGQKESLASKLEGDHAYYDSRIAGWWAWGICAWIGSGWCAGVGPWKQVDGVLVNTKSESGGTWRQLPHLGDAGQGVNRQLPHLGNAGQGVMDYMNKLAARIRRVRVCSGDWSRVCGPTVTMKQGLTGVFLDPPYSHGIRNKALYATDEDVSAAVRDWAIEQGNNKKMRIALCGYDGEHAAMPPGWETREWSAKGGYEAQGDDYMKRAGESNSTKERVWFSPHCLKVETQVDWVQAFARQATGEEKP